MTDVYSNLLSRLWLLQKQSVSKDMTLETTRQLNAALGCPHKQYKIVHVAGTNGKGSTVTKLACALKLSGYNVGTYTSPHISTFRERIQVNGELISEHEITELLAECFAVCEKQGLSPSFFELTTCAALKHFANKKVDYVVLEVGLGGRLDSTNIVNPILSIITSISLDHVNILGDTIEAIAAEKGGIIKPNTAVVLGPKACLPVLFEIAASNNAKVTSVEGDFHNYDDENNAIVNTALDQLPFPIPAAIRHIALTSRPPCRMEQYNDVILDVGHNADGITRLLQSLPWSKFCVVCGFSADKDVVNCLRLLQKSTHIHLVAANHERAMPIEILKRKAEAILPTGQFSAHASVAEGIKVASYSAMPSLICGSFFIMSEARSALGLPQELDQLNLNEPRDIQKNTK